MATRTKQLQRQLLEEDVPRAPGILGRPVKAVLAKGRANYLCRTAWEAWRPSPQPEFTLADHGLWLALRAGPWRPRTATARAWAASAKGESPLWDRINARAERCTGRQCPRFEDCYLTKLRQEIRRPTSSW